MVTKLGKNVVCIKDIPSNLIEEVFFILKTNCSEEEHKDKKKKEVIMSEINDIIKEYALKFQNEREQERKADIENKNKLKRLKVRSFWIAVAFAISCIFAAIIIK